MNLYNLPRSNFGAKVLTLTAIKGIGDRIEVQEPPDGLKSEIYRSAVPTRQIPALAHTTRAGETWLSRKLVA